MYSVSCLWRGHSDRTHASPPITRDRRLAVTIKNTIVMTWTCHWISYEWRDAKANPFFLTLILYLLVLKGDAVQPLSREEQRASTFEVFVSTVIQCLMFLTRILVNWLLSFMWLSWAMAVVQVAHSSHRHKSWLLLLSSLDRKSCMLHNTRTVHSEHL